MSSKFCRIYQKGAEPDSAFLLVSGDILLYLNEKDKYAVKGNNFIFGASEIILNRNLNIQVNRLETAIMHDGCSIKKISPDKFIEGLQKYSFALNTSMFIAKQVLLTNEIINKSQNKLDSDKKSHKDICVEYFQIISAFKKEYEKRKLPWMKEILSKYELSLAFKQGEIFFKASEPVTMEGGEELDSKTKSYPSGSVLIEQGEQGNDMLILQDGMLDVVVNGQKVALIKEKGTPVGEIALLLGEKRSATLLAKNTAVVTRITKADLKELSQKDNSLFISIANSLAQKHYNNVLKIQDIEERLISQDLDSQSEEVKNEAKSRLKASSELGALKKELSEAVYHKKADYLKDSLSDFIDL